MQKSDCAVNGLVPSRVFDSHAHLFRKADLNLSEPLQTLDGMEEATIAVWRERVEKQVGPGRLLGGLFFPHPTPDCDIRKVNEFLLAQLGAYPQGRGLLLISPQMTRQDVADGLRHPRVAGFKPYHFFSGEKPTMQSSIGGFLPEWAWKMADERGLLITLHLVRDLALADPDNGRYIREHCLRYPRATLILAHAARGFHARNTQAGIAALRGVENVWFDTSAICEPQAIVAILDHFGPRRLLWGSDFPISTDPGRCVSVGDSFLWLDRKSVNWDKLNVRCEPVPVGVEALRALKESADSFGLNEDDLQDVFYRNAARLLRLETLPDDLTQSLYRRAKTRIPGGTQLLSKRPEMLAPDQWPAYFREARGCETWDMDGRHYFDMSSNGIGACLLGFRDPDVTRAVQRRIRLGSMSTLNPPEEVELADRLCQIHPWAESVRFARCGGEIGAVAIRIARATTQRSLIAVCGYHGWQDWYLAANLGESSALDGHLLPGLDPLGVPRELAGTTLTFRYNHPEELQEITRKHGDRLAAVIMEPCRSQMPEPGFVEFVRSETRRCGALLVIDEITIGWRLTFGGAHRLIGITPDMAIFAKALGNGHPIAAVIGTKEAMKGAHDSFISSTYWTESVGPTAALATIRKLERLDAPAHVKHVGEAVTAHWLRSAKAHGLPIVAGDNFPCLAHFRFDHELAQELRTLYTQLMLERGFLAGVSIYPTCAHTDEVVSLYGEAIESVFGEIAKALADGTVKACLKGPVAHSGFRRLL